MFPLKGAFLYFEKTTIFIYSPFFINRENEVLKVQLKKYVGAVQMLRREGQTVEGKDKVEGEGGKSMNKGCFCMLPLRESLLEA